MNFRTTLFLAVLLAVAVGGLYLIKQAPKPEDDSPARSALTPPPGVRKLVEKELGDDIRKVVAQRRDQAAWTFEKKPLSESGDGNKWVMTSPGSFDVSGGDLMRLTNTLKDAQYEIAHKPGQAGSVTAAGAGLEPPEATVALTDDQGKTVEFEIGRAASESTTYMRLKGSPQIVEAKLNSKNLLKSKTFEWRELGLWTFAPDKATRVEVIDRTTKPSPTIYVLSKSEGKWVIESPVSARTTKKVEDMVSMLGRLRVQQWVDDRPEKLVSYGLEPAAWTLRATVVLDVPVAKKDDANANDNATEAEAEPATEKKTSVYEIHVSERSPIGEDTKAYVRANDEPTVATFMKATADRLKPVMSEWRDMRLTTANVLSASKVEITSRDGSVALAKKEGVWTIEPEGERAEDSTVTELLRAIGELKAVSFGDGESIDPKTTGLSKPATEVKVTIPGQEQAERFAVGGFTDNESKLLQYVRRQEDGPIAKVRVSDLALLMRDANAYRDRTVFNLQPSGIRQVSISTESRFRQGRVNATFDKAEDAWSMTAPLAAAIQTDKFTKLVDALSALKATAIVGGAKDSSAFGLNEQSSTVKFTYATPAESETEAGKDQSMELMVTKHDGKCFAKRGDRATIFEIAVDVYDQLHAEYRTTDVLTFDDAKVNQFSIKDKDKTYTFAKRDGKWKYKPEPDLPVDTKKVANLLLQFKDLKTEQYVDYAAKDLAAYGLAEPDHRAKLELEDGSSLELLVSSKSPEGDATRGQFAVVAGRKDVFLLSADMAKRFKVTLKELE